MPTHRQRRSNLDRSRKRLLGHFVDVDVDVNVDGFTTGPTLKTVRQAKPGEGGSM